jgi:hypothetical protein
MKESRKDFIKQGHKAACSEWKEKIEKEFPKLFKRDALEVGKWYRDGDFLQCFTGEFGNKVSYGFNPCGDFSNSIGLNKEDKFTPATDEEVEEALIKEAIRRGFKEGCEYIGIRDLTIQKATKNIDVWNCNSCIDMGFDYVFLDGKWATVIETITKEQAEKELGKTILN